MALTLVRILGWLVIAHGLSHAVLPMRGLLAFTAWQGDLMPTALYSISMVGFVAAGFGMLGMRPMDRAISQLLVLASAYSLVALFVLGDPSLFTGAVLDVALLLIGLWRGWAGWPAHPSHRRIWHVTAVTAGVAMVAYVGLAAVSYSLHRTWGSTHAELTMPLPGDTEPRDRPFEVQHAVTIDAPAEDVWVWLMQLGQDRGGFYSYDWLERAFGVDVHNVREVRPEWQQRQAGDFIRAAQPGYLGGVFGNPPGWTVGEVTPEQSLLIEKWGAFVLQPTDDEHTRFIIRSTMSNKQIPVWASAVNLLAFQTPHFIMQRRMLLTIKELAEERYAQRAADSAVQRPSSGQQGAPVRVSARM